MRRSQAPSFKKTAITDAKTSAEVVLDINTKNNTKSVRNVRSTDTVLDLLFSRPTLTDVHESEFVEGPDFSSEDRSSKVEQKLEESTAECSTAILKPNLKIFNVVYGKPTKKKHKTWEGDGTLEVDSKYMTLKDENNKILGTAQVSKSKDLEEGIRVFVGSKEVELLELTAEKAQKRNQESSPPRQIKKAKIHGTIGKKFLAPKSSGTYLKDLNGLVLPEPNSEHQWYFNKNSLPVTPVCIAPNLANKLRPHQQMGVIFLYECIMGFKESNLTGAILADEMGLGKTLQCITLIWTLLKQGPYGNQPVVKRVLIVTPSSLTMNWCNEFIKWLGREKLVPFVVDQKNKPSALHRTPVMIISYEMLVRCYEDVQKYNFDLIICDEGHRLKNSNIRTTQLLNQLDCSRRIILTGTPIQNDLQEFYALVDFVNPNVLGSPAEFRRKFEDPILASRQPNANEEVFIKGEECSAELSRKTSLFLLRRTHEVLDKYLPTKHEIVVFCKPTEVQKKVYNTMIDCLLTNKESFKGSDGVFHLGVIAAMRKVCSHPGLLRKLDTENEKGESISSQVMQLLPNLITMSTESSSKLTLVIKFLQELKTSFPREKVVLVSNSTQVLDMFDDVLSHLRYSRCRLDGSTPASQRSEIVDRFNRQHSDIFVFLLSAKAGGVGLNLTGASRLILFDSDWNPATDLQAMSRIWRDGQKHSVYIYRLLTTGTIEEKIYLRQIKKQGLCDGIIDPQTARSVKLSQEELKDIFSHCENLEECLTHEALSCSCSQEGDIPVPEEIENRSCQLSKQTNVNLKMCELMHWEHHGIPFKEELLFELCLSSSQEFVSFIFHNCTA